MICPLQVCFSTCTPGGKQMLTEECAGYLRGTAVRHSAAVHMRWPAEGTGIIIRLAVVLHN